MTELLARAGDGKVNQSKFWKKRKKSLTKGELCDRLSKLSDERLSPGGSEAQQKILKKLEKSS